MTFNAPAPWSGLAALGDGCPHQDVEQFQRVSALLRDAWMA